MQEAKDNVQRFVTQQFLLGLQPPPSKSSHRLTLVHINYSQTSRNVYASPRFLVFLLVLLRGARNLRWSDDIKAHFYQAKMDTRH
jgi:hypothetical protein